MVIMSEKAVAPHSSTLAWKILWTCSSWGRWGSDTTEQLHFHFSLSCIGEGNGNPLQCSCLENPRDRGAWWAADHGVAQSRTQLKWLSMVIMQERPQEKKETDVQKNRGKTPDQFPSHVLSSGPQTTLLWPCGVLYFLNLFQPLGQMNRVQGVGTPTGDQQPFVGVQGRIKDLKSGNGCSDSKN